MGLASDGVYMWNVSGKEPLGVSRIYKLNGVANVIDESKIHLYPNPSIGSFVIEFSEKANRTIRIVNAIGAEIHTIDSIEDRVELNLNLVAGMYLVIVGENTFRLVIN